MCLAIPALVKSIDGYLAEVEIGGLTRRASLQLTPEAKIGDYVLVHVGFAISTIDEAEAQQVFEYLREIGELAQLDEK